MRSQPGNPPHDMDTEFQPQVMDLICQGLKAPSIHAGRKLIGARQQAAKSIHFILAKGDVLELITHGGSVVSVPLDVHHNIFPAILFQMLGHKGGIV